MDSSYIPPHLDVSIISTRTRTNTRAHTRAHLCDSRAPGNRNSTAETISHSGEQRLHTRTSRAHATWQIVLLNPNRSPVQWPTSSL